MSNVLPPALPDAIQAIKARLIEKVTPIPGAGRVWNRIRYAGDLSEWVAIAAVEKTGGGDVIRCVFIYLAGWSDIPVESCLRLYTGRYGIEVIQGFYDGTDGDNSALFFETFLATLSSNLNRDLELGFTEGRDISHTGLQGTDGDGRPQYVDGVLAHRKVATLEVAFKYKPGG